MAHADASVFSRLEQNATYRNLALGVGFAVLYGGLTILFRWFAPDQAFSPLFPPAGIMFGLFLIGGWRWIPIALGVRIASIWWLTSPGEPFVVVVVDATIITLSYALCAELLRSRGLSRAHPAEFAWFAGLGVGLGPSLAAWGLAVRRSIVDGIGLGEAFEAVRTFWVGDALAIAAITPLTLVAMHALRYGRPGMKIALPVAKRTEYTLMILAVTAAPVASSVFVSRGGPPAVVVLATLPLLWVALRQDLIQAAVGNVVVVVLVSVTLRRALSFDELVEVQYLLLCGTVAAAFAATVRRAYEDTTAAVRVAEDRFAQIGRHAPIHLTEMSVGGALRTDAASPVDSRPDQRMIDDGVVQRWDRFGPALVARRAVQEFVWSIGSPDERFLDSLAIPIMSPAGSIDHVLVVTTDRTNLRRANQLAERAQTHDIETGLMNRQRFRSLVAELLTDDSETHGVMIVSFHQAVDMVDGAVDEVLPAPITAEIAACIAGSVGDTEVVARLGDHQFGVITTTPPHAHSGVMALRQQAERTLAALAASGGAGARLPVSIGISGGGSSADTMIARAERASRAAGELGGDRVLVYHPALHDTRRREWASIGELRQACDRSEFEVHYQPIVRMSDRSPVGAEALVRWRHPTNGLLLPGAFVPDAERSGLIVRIDDLVCDIVSHDVATWIDSDRVAESFTVSINISPVHLADPELLNRLQLLSTRIDPRRLRIEITESAAMRDPGYTVELLGAVRALGYTIILDDFGTGYSSMAWLHRLPVQVLKIDRTFVSGLAEDADARRIVQVMVGLAEDLGLSTTAEGIETEDEARLVTELGCGFGQGYLFGRPVPPVEAVSLFGSSTPR